MKQQLNDLLNSLLDYLPKLITATDDISEKLETGADSDPFSLFKAYFDGIGWVLEAIKAIQAADEMYLSSFSLEDLNGKLTDMEESMANQDYVMLSDILQYEIKEALEMYLEQIKKPQEDVI